MEQRSVGRSGLRVSALGLGTMGWGTEGTDGAVGDAHEAGELLTAFAEAGGTLVDTADVYGGGAAESLLGGLLADGVVAREDLVLATKTGRARSPGAATGPDTSARALLAGLDASLRRLRTDHVDLWLAHAWDPRTPPEEVARAMAAGVASGRVRYTGVADHAGWQVATAAAAAGAAGAPLAAAAVELSLLAGDDADVLPAARHHGLGVLAWAPLGRGVLTGKYRGTVPPDSRAASEHLAAWVEPYLGSPARRVAQAVATAADGLGAAPLEVALAWVRDRPGVASAVVGDVGVVVLELVEVALLVLQVVVLVVVVLVVVEGVLDVVEELERGHLVVRCVQRLVVDLEGVGEGSVGGLDGGVGVAAAALRSCQVRLQRGHESVEGRARVGRHGPNGSGWASWAPMDQIPSPRPVTADAPARRPGRSGVEYEYRTVTLPQGTSRSEASRLLTEAAEHGHWELARVRLYRGGRRQVQLRRRIVRVGRSAWLG